MMQSELVVIENTSLTTDEQSNLSHHESRIAFALDQATAAAVIIYTNLNEINKKRLYRDYGTFEDYCQGRWNKGRQWGYKIIEAARVLDTFVTHGVHSLPENERQIRPLTRLENPQQQIGAWDRAQELAEDEGRKTPTGRHVEQAVREWKADDQDVFTDSEAEGYQAIVEDHKAALPMAVHFSSDTPEWYTPEKVIDLVIEVFGQIDLDPCSNSDDPISANVPARKYYTAQTDGLTQQWFGKVYMNPPYGDEIGPWIEKLVSEFKSGRVVEALALVPARTDTAWIQPLYDYALCFVRGRLKFVGAVNGAPFPSLIAYLGPDNDLFFDCFEQIGRTGRLR
jgi:phage N-6-adenine-methyltransferase